MNLQDRIHSFVKLGEFISQLFCKEEDFLVDSLDQLKIKIKECRLRNGWFTEDNVLSSLKSISINLRMDNLESWINPYNIIDDRDEKRILLIMAGNIPLVGFHDLIATVITGNTAVVKLSSKDNILLPFLWEVLCDVNDGFSNKLQFIEDVEDRKFDAVIATGSDNSSRYFEYYFKNIPKVVRRNRNSLAIISGKETSKDLEGLADDIFMYFGLGCRSVSKLLLPKGYDLDILFKSFYRYNYIVNHKKYANNYDYNKAMYLMGQEKIIENGFLIMKQDKSLKSPVSVLHYEYYTSLDVVRDYILQHDSELQCIVSIENIANKNICFGESQDPALWDYSDDIDTVDFLIKI